MSKVMSALKDEIRRIARKEIRIAVIGLKRDRTVLKKTVAGLKKQTAVIQKNLNALNKTVAKTTAAIPAPEVEGKKARITGKGVRAVRRKLKLSQKAFGQLFGVSSVTVQNMEKKDGALNLRHKTRNAYLAIRGMGAREAKERLG
ncbi:MAG: hypothetical protein HY343_10770 [Lentisphaerae bacterium]|nr:hypothetical protein [Lentisphaerota bacterium]